MKAIIKRASNTARLHQRLKHLAWFLILWGIGVITIAGLAYLLRAMLDHVFSV